MKDLKHIETPRDWEIPSRASLIQWNAQLFRQLMLAWSVAAFFLAMFLIGCVTGWRFGQ